MERDVCVCEAVVELREQTHLSGGGETFARSELETLGLAIQVASKIDVADVVLDLARRDRVAVFEEAVARAKARLDGLFVAAEHRERDEFTHLRRGGCVRLAETLKARLRGVQMRDGLLHSPADERGYSRAPLAPR